MRFFSKAFERIQRVYRYEKNETSVDVHALQKMLFAFAVTMLLIDVENVRLEKTEVSVVVLGIALVSGGGAILLGRMREAKLVCILGSLLLLIMVLPISYFGFNSGFSLLWYFLLPIITLVVIGMPIGMPLCLTFGIYIMLICWTPAKSFLHYTYHYDFSFFYPFFYGAFCLLVTVMDVFYKSYQIQQRENEEALEKEVRQAVEQTQKLMVSSITTIGRMVDAKDSYTRQHSLRVGQYSRLIAENMEGCAYSEQELDLIYRSALLHDIGKIAVPDKILNKPAKLTEEEFQVMKQHTLWGKEILSGLEFLPQADLGATYHHERYDGSGYPYGLTGEKLPDIVHIISAADALDAMNSDRCYRKHCEMDYIIQEFQNGAGVQFEKRVAETVVGLLLSGKITSPGAQEAKG